LKIGLVSVDTHVYFLCKGDQQSSPSTSITEREEVFMREIEVLLGIEDMMRIFGLSRVSIYRKVAAARAGQSRFPVPLGESKERLRWCPVSVEAYCKTRSVPQPEWNK
jgi:predicted DNA-binding transcriptional regulator AlpA